MNDLTSTARRCRSTAANTWLDDSMKTMKAAVVPAGQVLVKVVASATSKTES
ncbi:MAG: hypothetical protein K8R60_24480 [Burkholderiales bacterium]|nr:hypothetical protein [Burkholderiales bacterium]